MIISFLHHSGGEKTQLSNGFLNLMAGLENTKIFRVSNGLGHFEDSFSETVKLNLSILQG